MIATDMKQKHNKNRNNIVQSVGSCHWALLEPIKIVHTMQKEKSLSCWWGTCLHDPLNVQKLYNLFNARNCFEVLQFQILKQFPSFLLLLPLLCSHNRIVIPSEEEIEYLEPAFATLKEINLSACGLSNWTDVLTIAGLWPNIRSVSLQSNGIAELSAPNTADVFRCLESLDLHQNQLADFNEIVKLGGVRTLKRLFLMKNGLRHIQLPDCAPSEYVPLFPYLEELNLRDNLIDDEMGAFNELDKLERLQCLCKTPAVNSGFEEMFMRAVALISGLRQCNKIKILPKMRRDAEVDIWKQLGMEYVAAQKGNEVEMAQFQRKCRAYSRIVKSKCGNFLVLFLLLFFFNEYYGVRRGRG